MTSTALVAVDKLVCEGRDLMKQGDDYYAKAGTKFAAAREAAGGFTLAYRAALVRAGISESVERRGIQFMKDPGALLRHRERDASYQKTKRATTSEREKPSQPKELPSQGEIHEAKQGFKAMIRKAAIAGDAGDWRTSHAKRTVAFAHFKKLLSASNLPALMGMTADEIIELIRTL